MTMIVDKLACYMQQEDLQTEVDGKLEMLPGPKHFIVDGYISLLGDDEHRVPIKALFDTGTDVTMLRQEMVEQLEAQLRYYLPAKRSFFFPGLNGPKPAYAFSLVFILPDAEHGFSSDRGFIARPNDDLDIADIYIGQDILCQYKVTFDGISGTLTIEKPCSSL